MSGASIPYCVLTLERSKYDRRRNGEIEGGMGADVASMKEKRPRRAAERNCVPPPSELDCGESPAAPGIRQPEIVKLTQGTIG
jgi:hypothetical protein